MFIRFCIAVLVVLAGTILAVAFLRDDGELAVYAIPVVLLVAAALAFKPQLDWAYYTRYPVDLDAPLVQLFAQQLPSWYQHMSEQEQLAFRQNTSLVRRGIDFKGQGFRDDDVPEDLAVLIASQLARLLPPKQYVLYPFETVVVYKHSFPSPQYPKHWHNSELFKEDAVLLFNIEQAIPGIFDPEQFNVVLYESVRAAVITEVVEEAALLSVSTETTLTPEDIADAIGLPESEIDWAAVAYTLQLDAEPVPSSEQAPGEVLS